MGMTCLILSMHRHDQQREDSIGFQKSLGSAAHVNMPTLLDKNMTKHPA